MSEALLERFDEAALERHARHLVLPEIGPAGQLAIGQAHVAVIGCGGLGANAALALAQAGVGRLELYDPDCVELSNLHRQPFTMDQLDQPKAEALAALCAARNPETQALAHRQRFAGSSAPIWLDCTDTDASRRALDGLRSPDTAVVFGAVLGMDGQVSVFPAGHPGFAGLFPAAPALEAPGARQTCAEQGVLGPLASLVAQLMAIEALKLAQVAPSPLATHLLIVDARDWRVRLLKR